MPTLAKVFTLQVAVQFLTACTGLVLIHYLPKAQYALYAVAVTVGTGLTLIAQSGISSALFARGGQIHDNPAALGDLVRSALAVRAQLVTALIIGGTPLLFLLLRRDNAGNPEAIAICVLVTANVWVALNTATYSDVLALKGRFTQVQRTVLLATMVRSLALLIVIAEPTIGTVVIFAAATLGGGLQNFFLRRRSRGWVQGGRANRSDKTYIRESFVRVLPSNAFIAVQSHILILVLAAVGETVNLADISAVLRYMTMFSLLNVVVVQVAGPAFARLPFTSVRARYLEVVAISASLSCGLLVAFWVFRGALIGLLGHQYRGLGSVLMIVAASSAVFNVADTMNTLNQARRWTKWAWIYVPLSTLWSALWLLILDFRYTEQAAAFGALAVIPILAAQIVQSVTGFRGERRGVNDRSTQSGNVDALNTSLVRP